MIDKLNDIFAQIKTLESQELQDILTFYFGQGLKLFEAKYKGETFDVSEQIKFISDLLGFNLDDIVMAEMNKKPETHAKDEITDFILQNSSVVDANIDKYREFIESTIKDIKTKV